MPDDMAPMTDTNLLSMRIGDKAGNFVPGYVLTDNGCITDARTVGHG
jgi:hypothetical protein